MTVAWPNGSELLLAAFLSLIVSAIGALLTYWLASRQQQKDKKEKKGRTTAIDRFLEDHPAAPAVSEPPRTLKTMAKWLLRGITNLLFDLRLLKQALRQLQESLKRFSTLSAGRKALVVGANIFMLILSVVLLVMLLT